MRAAVLEDVDRIVVRDVPRADPSATEVLVRVQAVGLCGTDIHIVQGHGNYNTDDHGRQIPLSVQPQILGHEIAGVVEQVGKDVTDLAAGDRVIIDQGRTCVSDGHVPVCEYCVSGDSHQCEHYRELGITGLPGGFAEYVTVPATNAVPLQSTLPAEQAAMVEPFGCVLHSMDLVRRSGARFSLHSTDASRRIRTVFIAGGGPAGQLFLQYLRSEGKFDGLVLLSEPNPLKRSLAERWGAVAIDPTATNVVDAVREHTDGRGVELLIEATGSGPLFRDMPGLIRKQATILLYGHGHTGVELGVLNPIQFREPTFVSPAGASGGHDGDGRPLTYLHALQLLEDGTIDVAPLITHRYRSLDDLAGAFGGEHLKQDYVKGMLLLGG
jgi:Threonine dehydrogenase and related Zn-dependent dehydrogenases